MGKKNDIFSNPQGVPKADEVLALVVERENLYVAEFRIVHFPSCFGECNNSCKVLLDSGYGSLTLIVHRYLFTVHRLD